MPSPWTLLDVRIVPLGILAIVPVILWLGLRLAIHWGWGIGRIVRAPPIGGPPESRGNEDTCPMMVPKIMMIGESGPVRNTRVWMNLVVLEVSTVGRDFGTTLKASGGVTLKASGPSGAIRRIRHQGGAKH